MLRFIFYYHYRNGGAYDKIRSRILGFAGAPVIIEGQKLSFLSHIKEADLAKYPLVIKYLMSREGCGEIDISHALL